jgi:hypothetical protein
MKRIALVVLSIVSASPLFADAGQRLIPAGSLIGCTISEPKLSSKNTAVGDPVLCQMGHSERYGRSVLPYNSYLVGRFEDYKDPGHFVGKGWMELKFDRMVVEPDTVIPIDVRVVDVPGYRVDNQGRILGKGHATRDVVLWTIPVLWPIDLLMMPMRGPRPTLKEETRLTLKVMDDLAVPENEAPQRDPYGLSHRQPSADNDPPPAPAPDPEPAPDQSYAPPQPDPQPQYYAYVPPPPPVIAYPYPPMVIASPWVGYGAYGYGPRVYGPAVRGYGYAGPRGYGYGGGPRAYANGPGPRAHGYGGGGPRGFSPGYGGGARASMSGRAGIGYGGGRR